jgi:uncharacterized membrane protein YedE/YeeE
MAATLMGLLLLAALTGFAAHRASVCTVRAVLEVVQSRTAHMLGSFLKAALWAALVFGLLRWVAPGPSMLVAVEPRPFALAGGFAFGLGATLNGACSYSTLQRIADGDLWGLTTLAGMALGVLCWTTADVALSLTRITDVAVFWVDAGRAAPWLLAALALLAAYEAWRIWQTPSKLHGAALHTRLLSPHYRVGSAALMMGVCAGLLYALHGGWSYTATLRSAVEAAPRGLPGPTAVQLVLFAAFFGGMLVSSVQRGSFKLNVRPHGALWRRLAGGAMMGAGAAMIPGGNDTLILTSLPALSAWALGAFVTVVLGVATGLGLMRLFGVRLPVVTCTDGVCREFARHLTQPFSR